MTNPEHLREITRPVASVAIISADNKILMGRKDPTRGGVYPDAWQIPGGGIEAGETPVAAARRESLEETGLDLSNIDLVPLPMGHGASPKTLPTRERVWANMTFHRFEARLPVLAAGVELKPGDDLVELRWFAQPELATIPQIPGGKEFFIQAGYINN